MALDVLVQEALGGKGELAVGARVDGGSRSSGDHNGCVGGNISVSVSISACPGTSKPFPLVLSPLLVPAEATGLRMQPLEM